MPAKKKSRAYKPTLSNITNKLSAAEVREHKKRRNLIVEDFKENVALRIEQMESEQEQLQQSIMDAYAIYRNQLLPWKSVTVKQLLQNEERVAHGKSNKIITETAAPDNSNKDQEQEEQQQSLSPSEESEKIKSNIKAAESKKQVSTAASSASVEPQKSVLGLETWPEEPSSCGRISDISALLAHTNQISKTAAKPKKKKAAAAVVSEEALTATRSSTRTRKPPIALSNFMAAPPSTVHIPRNKKLVDAASFVTPAGRRIAPTMMGNTMLVTPKFDPRVPLPHGTIMRRPLPHEVPMSLTGSPLRISPDKLQIEEIMSGFLSSLGSDLPAGELRQLHSAMDRFIESRPQ